jgi:uncharacterized phage protein (TIGR01671 family)
MSQTREIKLRAWGSNERKMVYPTRVAFMGSVCYCYVPGDDYEYQIDSEALMQWTGLKDKNGVECYHKDIATYLDEQGSQQTGVIEWQDYRWALEAIGGDEEGNQDIELHPDYMGSVEITANEYENPELLKAAS